VRPLVVLGATGSIGRQALSVAAELGISVVGLAAQRVGRDLAELAARCPGAKVAVAGGSKDEREAFSGSMGRRVEFGLEAITALAASPGCTILNGIVGAAGLAPSVAALAAGNRLALANKESLVVGGDLVTAVLASGGGELLPVDSEHSAVHQCLLGERGETIRRLVLTASGGPFRGYAGEELAAVTPEMALRHPTWKMGRRITIDSATLFNKGLEIIEAHHLFGVGYDRIEVIVHPESIVHSLVEFVDGSIKAQVGAPDMRLPIQYALTFPDRLPALRSAFDLTTMPLTFEQPDRALFPAIDLAYRAGREEGSSPAVLNAADEVAVAAFLEGRLGFTGIATVVEKTLDLVDWRILGSVGEALAVDREARAAAAAVIGGSC